jgi:hypothetical protein
MVFPWLFQQADALRRERAALEAQRRRIRAEAEELFLVKRCGCEM